MSSITDDVKKVVLSGIGAAAMTVEKEKESESLIFTGLKIPRDY